MGDEGQRVVVLAGGVGAARFLQGVITVVPPDAVTVICNVGDDAEVYGLSVSPDIDIVTYTLAGVVDPTKGFGLVHDTFHVIDTLARFGEESWFRLGDRDLATCLFRTQQLRAGRTLTEVTALVARSYGVQAALLPVTDDRVATMIRTPVGTLSFQDYFVRRRTDDEVLGIEFAGGEKARPAPGVLAAIRDAQCILIAPSNPFVSIGPILAVPGVRDALLAARVPVVAVSPIVGGEALKGPAARMFRSLGGEASAAGVAAHYAGLIDVLVIDALDRDAAGDVAAQGVRPLVTDTIMRGPREKAALARVALEAGGGRQAAGNRLRSGGAVGP